VIPPDKELLMTASKKIKTIGTWRFRREITLGTLLHLIVLLVIVITTWTNLQRELALIRHDLAQLITANHRLHQHIGILTDTCRNHEYRMSRLEQHNRRG